MNINPSFEMQKSELRRKYDSERKALSSTEYHARCVRICNNFFAELELGNVHVIHTFLSIDTNKEPDTWLIINKIHEHFPQMRISVPRVVAKTNDLENFFLDSLKQLVTNEWGIPEPVSGTETPIEDIDLIIVPLLAFDAHGHRVGYGKGFYDRFLRRCRKDAVRVGISLFPPVDTIDDVHEQDVALDYCVTPEKVFVFRPPVPAGLDNEMSPAPR